MWKSRAHTGLGGGYMRLLAALAIAAAVVLAHTLPTLKAPVAPTPSRAPASAGQAGVVTAADAADPPFEITEVRERCDNYDPFRQPFFGTTHLHTGLSFDASIRFVDFFVGEQSAWRLSLRQGPPAHAAAGPARVPGT